MLSQVPASFKDLVLGKASHPPSECKAGDDAEKQCSNTDAGDRACGKGHDGMVAATKRTERQTVKSWLATSARAVKIQTDSQTDRQKDKTSKRNNFSEAKQKRDSHFLVGRRATLLYRNKQRANHADRDGPP